MRAGSGLITEASGGGGIPARLAHVALAVRRAGCGEAIRAPDLGLKVADAVSLPEEGVRAVFVPVGEAALELLEPLDPSGPLGRFLGARGEGIHHVAIEVPDLHAAMARARDAGLRLTDDLPRNGAHGARIVFVHPKDTHGLLIELIESVSGVENWRQTSSPSDLH